VHELDVRFHVEAENNTPDKKDGLLDN
jgi:hypothetical protein